jgi:uncharacterized protein (DUF362 family)/Pyruvate/2-oxoacid:ferredoxin oxidoreductase delta subunit
MATVVLVKTETHAIRGSVLTAMNTLGGIRGYVSPGQKVLIKPNFVAAVPSAVTDFAVLTAVIDEVKTAGGEPFLGECPGFEFDSAATLRYLKVDKYAQDNQIKLINLEEDSYVQRRFDHPLVKRVQVARCAVEADVIINVPKMKSHKLTTVSLAIKNCFGLLSKESRRLIHAAGLHRGIAALYSLFHPALTVMDGLVIPAAGAVYGDRRSLGIIAASTDMLSLDLICSRLLGADPTDVEHIAMAAAQGYQEPEVVGDRIQPVQVAGLQNTPRRWLYRAMFRSVYAFDCAFSVLGGRTVIPWFHNRFGIRPVVNWGKCNDCGACMGVCEIDAIDVEHRRLDYDRCARLRCMACVEACETQAITTKQSYRSI